MSSRQNREDKNDLFEDFYGYAKVLQAWFVAYGIGGPVLLFTNDALRSKIVASGCARSITSAFLIGVGLQVLLTIFNKAALWNCYKGEREPKLRETRAYRVSNWFAYILWFDLIVDLGSLGLFAYSTYRAFTVLANT
ncbi:MAG TPA: hypothetical protein VGY56_08400 [Verrucomicrobiae bacterium]|nr:hypothetical protein [Verrucomicrobiae bacterium]